MPAYLVRGSKIGKINLGSPSKSIQLALVLLPMALGLQLGSSTTTAACIG
jgi:hypothetical protein